MFSDLYILGRFCLCVCLSVTFFLNFWEVQKFIREVQKLFWQVGKLFWEVQKLFWGVVQKLFWEWCKNYFVKWEIFLASRKIILGGAKFFLAKWENYFGRCKEVQK